LIEEEFSVVGVCG